VIVNVAHVTTVSVVDCLVIAFHMHFSCDSFIFVNLSRLCSYFGELLISNYIKYILYIEVVVQSIW